MPNTHARFYCNKEFVLSSSKCATIRSTQNTYTHGYNKYMRSFNENKATTEEEREKKATANKQNKAKRRISNSLRRNKTQITNENKTKKISNSHS